MQTAELVAFLRRNSEEFKKAAVPESVGSLVREQSETLAKLAADVETSVKIDLEQLERRLTVMEEKLFAALLTGTPDDVIVEVRAQGEREMSPYRSKMAAPQIDQLIKQYVNKKLLERYKLPRLSLFYM